MLPGAGDVARRITRFEATTANAQAKPKAPLARKAKGFSEPEAASFALVFDGADGAEREVARAEEEQVEADDVLEEHLERVRDALAKRPGEVPALLAARGRDLAALAAAQQSPQLSDDLTGWEVRVHAAQALDTCRAAVGEDLDLVAGRVSSEDPMLRTWGARAVRALRPKSEARLLAPLAKDAFRDGDGAYLVGEAAGLGE